VLRRTFAAAVPVLLLLAASASAAQRYAAPNGTANLTCTQAAPCDIVTAINGITNNMPKAGDRVILAPGSYYKLGTASTPLSTTLDPPVDINIQVSRVRRARRSSRRRRRSRSS
jgi:type 1 fimbria pilin